MDEKTSEGIRKFSADILNLGSRCGQARLGGIFPTLLDCQDKRVEKGRGISECSTFVLSTRDSAEPRQIGRLARDRPPAPVKRWVSIDDRELKALARLLEEVKFGLGFLLDQAGAERTPVFF